jgi:hypothetical protein
MVVLKGTYGYEEMGVCVTLILTKTYILLHTQAGKNIDLQFHRKPDTRVT